MNVKQHYLEDLFHSQQFEKKKPGKFPALDKYKEHRFLPHVKISLENLVIISIGVLIVVIVAFAIGVERGKAVHQLSQIDTDSVLILGSSGVREVPEDVREPESEGFIAHEGLSREAATAGSKPVEPVPHHRKESSTSDNGAVVKDSVYTMQLASFRNRDHAIEEVRKLKNRGVKADYTYKSGWFQVFAFGYMTKEAAQLAKEEFGIRYIDCYIKRVK